MTILHLSAYENGTECSETSAAVHLLKSCVRIPPGAWIFVCCECRVLSGRGLCDELITRSEGSYRLCCVVVCDLETSRMGAPYIYGISSLKFKLYFLTIYHIICLSMNVSVLLSSEEVERFL
jgi:hypothetical protein